MHGVSSRSLACPQSTTVRCLARQATGTTTESVQPTTQAPFSPQGHHIQLYVQALTISLTHNARSANKNHSPAATHA